MELHLASDATGSDSVSLDSNNINVKSLTVVSD